MDENAHTSFVVACTQVAGGSAHEGLSTQTTGASKGVRALTAENIAYFFPYLDIEIVYVVALNFAMALGPFEGQRGSGGTLSSLAVSPL